MNFFGQMIRKAFANEGFARVFKTTFWLQLERIWAMVIGIVVTMWVARYLEPEGFGIFSYALAIASIVQVIGQGGTPNLLLRDLSLGEGDQGRILGAGTLLRFVATFVIACVTFFGLFQSGETSDTILMLLAFMLVGRVLMAFENARFLHSARNQGLLVFLSTGLGLTLGAAAKVILILIEAPVEAFGITILIEGATVGAMYLLIRAKDQPPLRWPEWSRIRVMAIEAIPLALSSAAVVVYMRIDVVMLEELRSAYDAGIYAAAVRLSDAWYFVPTTIVHATAAPLLRSKKVSFGKYRDRLRQLFQGLVLFSYALALCTTLVAGPVIKLFFGVEYVASAPVLAVHIWAISFVSLGVASSQYLLNEGLKWLIFCRTVAGAISNVGLNLWLIPLYGPMGAALSTLISYCVSGVLVHALGGPIAREMFWMQLRSIVLGDVPLLVKEAKGLVSKRF